MPAGGVGLSRLRPALIAAYRAARYEVCLGPTTVRLRVGERAPPVFALWLGACLGGVFLTACAPEGRPRRPGAEHRAHARLVRRLRRSGIRHLAGEGGDDRGAWRAEPSVLVPLSRPRAAAGWGRAFRQNAVLWVPRRGAVRLFLLR